MNNQTFRFVATMGRVAFSHRSGTRPAFVLGDSEMANKEKLNFDQGWNAAIAEVKEKVEGYIEAKRGGQPVDPWEEWLPRLLRLMAEP